jgi:hypothetical protein
MNIYLRGLMKLEFPTFLEQTSLVYKTIPFANEIIDRIDQRSQNKIVKVMYGETYDRFGPTLGSLKYYFSVSFAGLLLRQSGINVSSTILLADVATCRNEPDDQHDELMEIGKKRAFFLRTLNDIYGLDLNILLMSEYIYTSEFQEKVNNIREMAKEDAKFYEWIVKTVPESKVDIESKKDFAYAFDEVATIIGYDIKIGPPRELFYDEPARMIASSMGLDPLLSIYLHPTYPLGFGRSFFLGNEEIEKYGVTPYKAGSKGLEANRIILGTTEIQRIKDLIVQSVVSKNQTVPNAVLDVVIIAEMAGQLLSKNFSPITIREQFYEGNIQPDQLRQIAIESLTSNIINVIPLNTLKGISHVG